MILNKPRENNDQFTGDEVKGSEQLPVNQPLPAPNVDQPGIKGSEQGTDYPVLLSAPKSSALVSNEAAATLPPPKSALQTAEEKYNTLQNQETPKDNDKSFIKRLGATLREFGKRAIVGGSAAGPNASMSERLWASLGGGLAGTIGYQFDPQVDERENLQNQRAKAWRDYQVQNEMETQRQERDRIAAQTQTIYNDDMRQQQATDDLRTFREGQLLESAAKRESNERNAQMRTVSQMWAKLPNYDPADPRFAEITKAMGDVNLPLTPKDSKKVVKQIQDAETGAWSLTLTDPVSGVQEVRPITTKDGKQLVTTSTAKVMSNAAGERQLNDLTFKREVENNRREQFMKNFNYKVEQDAKDGTLKKIELQNKIQADYNEGKIDEATRDEMLATINKF